MAERIGLAVMVQGWEWLTFLHWRYEPGAVQPLLPAGLELDTFDGSAWVGLTPFVLRLGIPPGTWLARFPETNLRTYVRGPAGGRGVWFFSLDTARLAAVLGARAVYSLPYKWAEMRVEREGGRLRYRSRRRWPGPGETDIQVEAGEPYTAEELGELDHFLTARFRLYTVLRRGLGEARVEHPPWPLRRARVLSLYQTLTRAAGLPEPVGPPLAHYSPGVEVRVGPPRKTGD